MITILPIRADDLRPPVSYATGVYSDRSGKAFTGWQSNATDYGIRVRLRLRVERAMCRAAIRRYSE